MSFRSGSEARDVGREKATTARSSVKNNSINRSLRDAFSPSPDASPRSPSPPRHRDRSRSPYRANKSPPGNRKRNAPDDYRSSRTDTRQFRVHYEEGRPSHHDDGAGRGSYAGRSGTNLNDRHGRGRDDREDYNSKRRRTRSRSTERAANGASGEQLDYGRPGAVRFEKERDPPNRNGYEDRTQKTSGTGGDHSRPSTGHSRSALTDRERNRTLASKSVSFDPNISQTGLTENGRSATDRKVEEVAQVVEEPVNEADAIEERRKRREAIKAKYKSQSTPLLVQALQQDSAPVSPASHVDTPNGRSERSASPSMFGPQTPRTDSNAGSPPPVSISNDFELANTATAMEADANEPSAADYDAAADMAEERARHDKRNLDQDISASNFDDTKQEDRQLLLSQAAIEAKAEIPAPNPADNMFASDDEDDMFAIAGPKKTSDGVAQPSVAVPIPAAKQLDQSLLDNWDDHEGYYRIILGELLEGRYHVQANLGKGMFSSVVRALDNTTGQLVAIKVIRNNETMIKAATKEMEILEKLQDADPDDKKHLIRLERYFTHKGHMCMVFEHMSDNLREVLKKFGRDIGIHLGAVRSYAQQIFLGLSLMRKCEILHADLKPDNILVNEARNKLKICDLGSAADAAEGNEITPYLVSRFYRAPEIILGIPYDYAIDMWSIGCTLYELYTGKILFTGRSNNQMLRSIMECRGKFSLKMLKKAEFGAVHFDDVNLNFRSVETDKVTGREMTKLISFVKPTRDLKSRLIAAASRGLQGQKLPEADLKEVNLFADLLDKCLNLNPEKRITPAEALKHPFILRPNLPVPRQA